MKVLARCISVFAIVFLFCILSYNNNSLSQVINNPVDSSKKSFFPENQLSSYDSIYPEYGIKVTTESYPAIARKLKPVILGCELPGCLLLREINSPEVEVYLEFQGNEFQESLSLAFQEISLDSSKSLSPTNLIVERLDGGLGNPIISRNNLILSSGRYRIRNLIASDDKLIEIQPSLDAIPDTSRSNYKKIFLSIEQKIKVNNLFSSELVEIQKPYKIQYDFVAIFRPQCLRYPIPVQGSNIISGLKSVARRYGNSFINEISNGPLIGPTTTFHNLPFLIIKGKRNDQPVVFLDGICKCDFSFGSQKYFNDYQLAPYEFLPSYNDPRNPEITYYFYYLGGIGSRTGDLIDSDPPVEASVTVLTKNFKMAHVSLFGTLEPIRKCFWLSGFALEEKLTLPINIVITDPVPEPGDEEAELRYNALKDKICEELFLANCILRRNKTGIKLSELSKNDFVPLPDDVELRDLRDTLISRMQKASASGDRERHQNNFAEQVILGALPSLNGDKYYDPNALNIYYSSLSYVFGEYIHDNIIFVGGARNDESLIHEIGHALSVHHTTTCEFKCEMDGSNSAFGENGVGVEEAWKRNIMCVNRDGNCELVRYEYSAGQVINMNLNRNSALVQLGIRDDIHINCQDHCLDFLYKPGSTCPCTGLTAKTI